MQFRIVFSNKQTFEKIFRFWHCSVFGNWKSATLLPKTEHACIEITIALKNGSFSLTFHLNALISVDETKQPSLSVGIQWCTEEFWHHYLWICNSYGQNIEAMSHAAVWKLGYGHPTLLRGRKVQQKPPRKWAVAEPCVRTVQVCGKSSLQCSVLPWTWFAPKLPTTPNCVQYPIFTPYLKRRMY